MGLALEVGILADLKTADEEGYRHFQDQFELVNQLLTQNGLPAHTESEDRYDVIVATGSFPVMPQWLQGWLKIGGRLFVVTGEEPAMEAWLITRVGEKEWSSENLFETVLAPLENVPQPAKFVF